MSKIPFKAFPNELEELERGESERERESRSFVSKVFALRRVRGDDITLLFVLFLAGSHPVLSADKFHSETAPSN